MKAFWPICLGHALVKKGIWSTIYKSSGFKKKKEREKERKIWGLARESKNSHDYDDVFPVADLFSFADENHR